MAPPNIFQAVSPAQPQMLLVPDSDAFSTQLFLVYLHSHLGACCGAFARYKFRLFHPKAGHISNRYQHPLPLYII
jgi:hypothetical protein